MERLKLILAVFGHGLGERMGAALERAGCAVCFHLSGQGTAKAAWLEMLGLSAGDARYFAVAIPLSGIAGRDAYEQLAQGGTAHGKSV